MNHTYKTKACRIRRVSGRQDVNNFFFARSSPLHQQKSNHIVNHRLSWHETMRIYDDGFRCVADNKRKKLSAKPKYAPPLVARHKPVALRADLFLKESTRLAFWIGSMEGTRKYLKP